MLYLFAYHALPKKFLSYYQVVLPFGLQRDIDLHLAGYLSHKARSSGSFLDKPLIRSNSGGIPAADEVPVNPEPFAQNSVALERILRRRSLQIRDKQQEWQVSFFDFFNYARSS